MVLIGTPGFSVNVSKITKGFLPDLDINLFSFKLLLALGNDSSWFPGGVYLRVFTNVESSLIDSFTKIINQFTSIIKFVGKKPPGTTFGVT